MSRAEKRLFLAIAKAVLLLLRRSVDDEALIKELTRAITEVEKL